MIELPEASLIAHQITTELAGKRIASAMRGNTPHKFAFYNRSPEEYAEILKGRRMGTAYDLGSLIIANVEPDYALMLGFGGERILYHESESSLPKKHHLLLHFEGDTYLSVTVQGWGFAQLWLQSEVLDQPCCSHGKPSPLSENFTLEYFDSLFGELEPEDPRSAKLFMISKPGILGIGNGYLQDILFRARLHPRHRVRELSLTEKKDLYTATRETIQQALALDGRDTEFDLHNRPGRYQRIMVNRSVGKPCPTCGTPIEKAQYLGGAVYYCPSCQK